VLVHCWQGKWSATLVVAFVMASTGMQALKVVQAR
jgi:hypothetical protein